jgi:hypothetical protein
MLSPLPVSASAISGAEVAFNKMPASIAAAALLKVFSSETISSPSKQFAIRLGKMACGRR